MQQLETGELRGELEAVRLHPRPDGDPGRGGGSHDVSKENDFVTVTDKYSLLCSLQWYHLVILGSFSLVEGSSCKLILTLLCFDHRNSLSISLC